jgi:hypothetical protein
VARAVLNYPVRGPESLATLFDRPERLLERWDQTAETRHLVALAGADAHGRLGLLGGDPYGRASWLHLPSYEASFRVFALRVDVEKPLTGNAASDAAALLAGLRAGHLYTAIDALAGPAAFELTATSGPERASEGDSLPLGGPVELRARSNAPRGASTVLLRNGRVVRQAAGPVLSFSAEAAPAVYRVEVRLPNAPGTPPVPWVLSNPIYAGLPRSPAAVAPPRRIVTRSISLLESAGGSAWRTEDDPASKASLIRVGGAEPALVVTGTLAGAFAPVHRARPEPRLRRGSRHPVGFCSAPGLIARRDCRSSCARPEGRWRAGGGPSTSITRSGALRAGRRDDPAGPGLDPTRISARSTRCCSCSTPSTCSRSQRTIRLERVRPEALVAGGALTS